jgi:TusA-related sulfurtransferase
MHKQLSNEESAQIIKVLKERPCTMREISDITGKTFSAARVLVDTLSIEYPIAQKNKKYYIPKYDMPEYVKELAGEYKLLEYNDDTGKYDIIGKKIDFVRYYIKTYEYEKRRRLIPYKKFCDTMQYISGFTDGLLRRFYYIVINERL